MTQQATVRTRAKIPDVHAKDCPVAPTPIKEYALERMFKVKRRGEVFV